MHVDGSRDVANLLGEFFRNYIITDLIRPRYRDIDRSRGSEIQNLRHDVRRLKEELHAGKRLWQFFAEIVDVSDRGFPAFFFQLDHNFGIGRPKSPGVAVAEIDATVRNTDVVENGLQFRGGNGFANDGVHLISEAGSLFDAKTRARAKVQTNLSGIDFGKEIPAKNYNKTDGKNAESQETTTEKLGPIECRAEPSTVAFAEFFEGALETLLVPAEEALLFACMLFGIVLILAAEEIHSHGRDNRSGPAIGCQHREDNGFGERHEQEFRHARKEKHGNENDADAECGDESWDSNLLSSVENGLDSLLAHGQIAVDIFNFHRSVVHQDADRQG